MDDDYNSADDDVVATAPGLSRRKRKLAKRELQEDAPQQQQPAKKLRRTPDEADNGGNATKQKKKPSKQPSKQGGPKPQTAKDREDQSSIDPAVAGMDSKMTADFVVQRIKKLNKDLSFVELGDRILPERLYLDTSSYTSPRSLANLCAYLETFCTKKGQSSISHLKSSPKAPGAPHTLVVAPAALRAADLVRVLRRYQTPDAAIPKFFAKHVKLADAVAYARKTRIGIAVGTPARLIDLIKEGAVQTRYLQRVVLDVSYLDAKQRGMWDIKEVQDRVVELLGMEGVRKRLEGGGEDDSRGVMFY